MNTKQSIQFDVHIPPEIHNDNRTVVRCTIVHEAGLVFQGIGAADTNDMKGDGSIQGLIDLACNRALHNAQKLSSLREDDAASQTPTVTSDQRNVYQPNEGRRLHKKEAGSMTSKQQGYLERLAKDRGSSLREETMKKYGLEPNSLSSHQANELIEALK